MISFIGKEIDYLNQGITSCSNIPWESINKQILEAQQVESDLQLIYGNKDQKENSNSPVSFFTLNLNGNRLSNLHGLPNISFIDELILSGNLLKSCILPELVNLINLQTLDLSCNTISALDGLPFMPKLRSFLVAYNEISTIPDLTQSIPNIENIDLRCNQLQTSHSLDGLASLHQLRHLKLASNAVIEIPASMSRLFIVCPSLISIDDKERSHYSSDAELLRTPKIDAYLEKIKSQTASPSEKRRELEEHYRHYPITSSKVLFPDRNSQMTSTPLATGLNPRKSDIKVVENFEKVTPALSNPWKSKITPIKEKVKKFRVHPALRATLSVEEDSEDGEFVEDESQVANGFANAFLSKKQDDTEQLIDQSPPRTPPSDKKNSHPPISCHQNDKNKAVKNIFNRLCVYSRQVHALRCHSFFYHWQIATQKMRFAEELLLSQTKIEEQGKMILRLQEDQTKQISDLNKKILQEKAKTSQLSQRIIQQEMIISELKSINTELENRVSDLLIEKEETFEDSLSNTPQKILEESHEKILSALKEDYDQLQLKYDETVHEVDRLLQNNEELTQKNTTLLNKYREQETLLQNHQQKIIALEKEKASLLVPPVAPVPAIQDPKHLQLDKLQQDYNQLQLSFNTKLEEFQEKERKSLEKERNLLLQYQQLLDKNQQLDVSSHEQKQFSDKLETRLLMLQTAFEELSGKYEAAIAEKLDLEQKQQKSLKTIKDLSKCIKKLQQITDYRQQQDKEKEEQHRLKVCEKCLVYQRKIDSIEQINEKVVQEKQILSQENQRLLSNHLTKEQEYHQQLTKQVEAMEKFMKEIETLQSSLQEKEKVLQQYQQSHHHYIEKYEKQLHALKQQIVQFENEQSALREEISKKNQQLLKRREIEKKIKHLINQYLVNNSNALHGGDTTLPVSFSSFLSSVVSSPASQRNIPSTKDSSSKSRIVIDNAEEKEKELEFFNLLQSIDNSGIFLSDAEETTDLEHVGRLRKG